MDKPRKSKEAAGHPVKDGASGNTPQAKSSLSSNSPNPITYRSDGTSIATYSSKQPPNPRKDPAGSAVDKKVRRELSAGTGRAASHRQSLSGGVDPSDKGNLLLMNANQNVGTRLYIEKWRDKQIQDPNVTVTQASKPIGTLPGSADPLRTPLAEKIALSVNKGGQPVQTTSVTLANVDSSGSRYVDAMKLTGQKPDPQVVQQLNAKDQANFRAQHGPISAAQEKIAKLRAAGLIDKPRVVKPAVTNRQHKPIIP